MLNIEATNDKELLDNLSKRISGEAFGGNVAFVLYVKDEPIGIASFKISTDKTVSELCFVGIVPESRKLGYGDFLTRAMMLNLSNISKRIVVDSADNYFLKFGFSQEGAKMQIDAKDLVFPRKCQSCN